MRTWSLLLTLFVVMTSAAGARADDTTRAQAEALFAEGQAHLKASRIQEAATAFERSYRLSGGEGALINLAYCHEKLGQMILAVREYTVVSTKTAKSDRRAQAEERLRALSAGVPGIFLETTVVPDGLKVTIDGEPLDPSWHGTPRTILYPVEVGDHRLLASAPGRGDESLSFHVDRGKTEKVSIPVPRLPNTTSGAVPHDPGFLVGERREPTAALVVEERSATAHGLIIGGIATGVIGLGALGTGLVLASGSGEDKGTYYAVAAVGGGLATIGLVGTLVGFSLPLERRTVVSFAPKPQGAMFGLSTSF